MALVVAGNVSREPELNLIQALDEYRQILPDEDRSRLEAEGTPNTMAAISLATVIDADCSTRRRHCMGQRLITFLD